MSTLVVLLSLLILVLTVYITRIHQERETLRRELRRVLRAGAGKVEAQSMELNWYRAICHTLPLPVVVTDARKGLLYANPAAQRVFGSIEKGEGAIKRLRHHVLEELLDMALESGQSEPHRVELPGDQQYLVLARAWPLQDAEPRGALLILQDIAELNRLARARRDMAANLSHELRTPLTSVKLLTETLLDGAIEEPSLARKFVNHIATENEALIRLVEDLTALSGIESGRTPLHLEPINLRELIDQRLQRLIPQAEQKQVQFRLDSPPSPILSLDPERFGQVLTNVLDNAIKFSPEGGTVSITVCVNEEDTTLAIRDEGPGIPPHELPRIFERFYKGDRARTRSNASGTGLGLAIVRHLVEAHGGTIHAKSEFGGGTTFVITMPHG
ncbi:MAG: ATP-binding protein [Chloroflexota bacterium]|nr:ATP-binding protein [Chloroflexota bacterium]